MDVNVATLIEKYGFPIVAIGGMMGLIYYVWIWVTQEIKPVLSDCNVTLIELVDGIRKLDNDLIRLDEKIRTTIHFKDQQ